MSPTITKRHSMTINLVQTRKLFLHRISPDARVSFPDGCTGFGLHGVGAGHFPLVGRITSCFSNWLVKNIEMARAIRNRSVVIEKYPGVHFYSKMPHWFQTMQGHIPTSAYVPFQALLPILIHTFGVIKKLVNGYSNPLYTRPRCCEGRTVTPA